MSTPRIAEITRATKETDIHLCLHLDGSGASEIATGFGFADHMLTLLAFWAKFDLCLKCTGDLHIDAHHTLEDIGLTLGQALSQALGDKAGIRRMGEARAPMDEALAEVTLDLSGRPFLVYREDGLPPVIAGEEKDVWREFFKALCSKGMFNLHVNIAYGQNGHHMLEAVFKALGLALRQAVTRVGEQVPSTKGSVDV